MVVVVMMATTLIADILILALGYLNFRVLLHLLVLVRCSIAMLLFMMVMVLASILLVTAERAFVSAVQLLFTIEIMKRLVRVMWLVMMVLACPL